MTPFTEVIKKTTYKAKEEGIEVVLQEESHTSKCSFLDNETIGHKEEYLGKRIMRGTFRSADGTLINADVNAGYNIIRKSDPEVFVKAEIDGVGGCGLHPVQYYI